MDSFLQTALTVLTLASIAGLGLLGSGLKNLRDNLTEARAEIGDKDRRLLEAHALITQLQHDLEALRRVVTGEAQLVALGEKLDEHHAEAQQHWTTDEELLGMILQSMRRRAE